MFTAVNSVVVRPLAGFGLAEHVRISIGTAEENERLVKALRKLCEGELEGSSS